MAPQRAPLYLARMDPAPIVTPAWVAERFDFEATYESDESRMRVAVDAARENVLRGTGGPFGAAVFAPGENRLVSVGVNLVMPLGNSALHAEMVAFMIAQRRFGHFSLALGGAVHELHTSCEPCAMCLGGVHWSGVKRVVWAATREDALGLGFDEGPVFPESYAYLRDRGITFDGPVLRKEGRAALELYLQQGGALYNG
jgi:tRNA(Arg) A34 adenosine deaminase TadA